MEKFRKRIRILFKSLLDDKEALFKDIWEFYQPGIHFFVSGYVKTGGGEADDLVQEIMFKAFRNIEKYNPLYSFDTWIYTIARNRCIDWVRKEGSRTPVAPLEDPGEVESGYGEPAAEMIGKELEGRIELFMESLEGGDKQLALLRFREQMGYKNISKVLDVPVGTLKSRVHKMKARLIPFLEGYYEK